MLKVLLATLINGVAAVIFLLQSLGAAAADRVNWPLAAAMVVAAAFGGFFGMHVARRIKQEKLRLVILLLGIALTVIYGWRAYAVPA